MTKTPEITEAKLAALEAPIAAPETFVEECGRAVWRESARVHGLPAYPYADVVKDACDAAARAVISLAWQRFAAAMHGEESFVAFADAVGPNDLTAREDFARRMRAALTRALASLGAPDAAAADGGETAEPCPVDAAYLERWRHGIVDTADHADEAPYIGQVRAMARTVAWCAGEIQRLSGGAAR